LFFAACVIAAATLPPSPFVRFAVTLILLACNKQKIDKKKSSTKTGKKGMVPEHTLSTYESRLKTFGSNWPHDKDKQDEKNMARAGLYRADLNSYDSVWCRYCHHHSRRWRRKDNPLHSHYFSCVFSKAFKDGIDEVANEWTEIQKFGQPAAPSPTRNSTTFFCRCCTCRHKLSCQYGEEKKPYCLICGYLPAHVFVLHGKVQNE
jgi:hypothetical protein